MIELVFPFFGPYIESIFPPQSGQIYALWSYCPLLILSPLSHPSQSDRITTKSVVHVLRCIRQLACRTDRGHTKPQHLRSSHSPAVPPIPRPTEPSNIHPDHRVLFLSSDLVVTLDVRLCALTYCIVKDYERTDHDRFTQGCLSVHRRVITPDQTPPRYIQTREKLIGKSSITKYIVVLGKYLLKGEDVAPGNETEERNAPSGEIEKEKIVKRRLKSIQNIKA